MRAFSPALSFACLLVACKPEQQSVVPARRAGRGEPCQVVNDCKEPLLCLSGRCLDANSSVMATNKQCAVVACTEDSDCCPRLDAFDREDCERFASDCAVRPGSSACQLHELRCQCQATCQGYQCVDQRPVQTCTSSEQCVVGSCRDGACAECSDDAECGEAGFCSLGRCLPGCSRDEQCGALERCEAARCVPRGCISDRECVHVLQRRDAVCRNELCSVPCQSDAACQAVERCMDGVCVDLGCEQSADCEARLRLRDDVLVLCLDAAEVRSLPATPPELDF